MPLHNPPRQKLVPFARYFCVSSGKFAHHSGNNDGGFKLKNCCGVGLGAVFQPTNRFVEVYLLAYVREEVESYEIICDSREVA